MNREKKIKNKKDGRVRLRSGSMRATVFRARRGGTLLLLTILILTSVLTVSLTAAEIIRIGLIMGRTQLDATKAYFAAEAGAEQFLWDIRAGDDATDDPGCALNIQNKICFDAGQDIATCAISCSNPNTATSTLGNAAKFSINYMATNATSTATSTGMFREVRRVIVIKY